MANTKAASAAKSRAAVASTELSAAAAKPRSAAIASGSRPNDEPASAPEPYGDTAARLSKSTILSTSRSNGWACASRWCASRIGWADCRWVLPGMMAVGCAAACAASAADDVEHAAADPSHRVPQPHPEQRCHLVVARPPGPQAAAEFGPDPVDQPALQRGVHVLVADQRTEAAVSDVLGEAVEAGQQPVALLFGEQPGPEEHHGVSTRRGDVVGSQHPVEVGGFAQRGQRVGRPVGEPAAPQRPLVGAHASLARSRRAASLDDSPCT